MSSAFERAQHELLTRGAITLPGAPSGWSNVVNVLLYVLLGLAILIAIGLPVGLVVMVANGADVLPGGLLAIPGAFVPLLLVWFLRRGFRRSLNAQRRNPVILAPQGLTVRGIGPIPWHQLNPPTMEMVPAQFDSGYERRAVMMLTRSGMQGVASVPPAQRKVLGPATGGLLTGGQRTTAVYLPSAQGISGSEMMRLCTLAHQLYAQGVHHG